MSILFKNCKLLLRSENADGSPAYRAEDGFLGVEGKTIDYIGAQRPEKQYGEEKDMAGNLLMPGLANAHGHAAMTLVRGVGSDLSLQDWNRLMQVNVTSLYNTCHTYVPDMVSAGGGRILNVSSVWGLAGASCEVAYSASKGAVNAFTRALARELAPSHIRVNAIALGIVDTRMNARLTEEETAEIRDQIPAGYIASPEEAAQAMLRLLDMPEYFNGEIVRFDGCWI